MKNYTEREIELADFILKLSGRRSKWIRSIAKLSPRDNNLEQGVWDICYEAKLLRINRDVTELLVGKAAEKNGLHFTDDQIAIQIDSAYAFSIYGGQANEP